MTSQQATCSHCGQTYRVDESQVGRKAKCRDCGKVFMLTSTADRPSSPQTISPPLADSTGATILPKGDIGENPPSTDGSRSTHSGASANVSTNKEATDTPSGGNSPGDRFDILSKLGAGAFGTVYRARDRQLDREVALKIPQHGVLNSKLAVQRFFREARAAGNLRHPNIVPIYDAGRLGKTYFIALGYIDGQTLDIYAERNQLSHNEIAWLIAKMAQALHYAHTRPNPVVHRDMKPSNVMIDTDGEPMILDFGIARRDEGDMLRTQEGQQLGTPAYMSPEQHAGQSHLADSRSDQWSLGVMLYELLTGSRPFDASTVLQMAYQVREVEPEKPSKRNSLITRDLETICLKCLEKEPDKRYPTCQALSDELTRYTRNEPIEARPITPIERGWRLCKRNPILSLLTLSTLLILFTAATVSVLFALRANTNAQQALIEKQRAEEALNQVSTEKKRGEAEKRKRGEAEKRQAEAEAEKERVKVAKSREERLVYCMKMQAAGQAWDAEDITQVRSNLDACPIRFRGWEYRHMRALLENPNVRGWEYYGLPPLLDKPLTLTPKGYDGFSGAFSPDCKWIASGSEDNTVKVWNAVTGKEKWTLKGHSDRVWSVGFSPDGKRIASGSDDKTVKVWDVVIGELALTLKGHSRDVRSVAFSPDGKRIVSAGWWRGAFSGTQSVKMWDALSGEEISTFKEITHDLSGGSDVAFSPDGKWIAYGVDGDVGVWNAATGEHMLTFTGHSGHVSPVAFSPDCRWIASGSGGNDNTVKVWNAATGKEKWTLKGHSDWVSCVGFSPDGKRIASGSGDNTLKIWDATTGALAQTLKGHSDAMPSVAFSPDGKWIVSGSYDDTVKFWEATSSEVAISRHSDNVSSIAMSPDGKRIVSASTDKTVKVWGVATGRVEMTLNGHSAPVSSVAFSLDGKWIASGSDDKTVKVWDAATGKEKWTLNGHSNSVSSVAFSSDGKRIASGSDDKTVKVWDAITGESALTLDGHSNSVSSVAFSPDGKRIASGSDDKTVKVWDAITGESALTLNGHSNSVSSVAFSPDGKRIVSASTDKTMKVWDVATGELALTLNGHSGKVRSVAFSPDGKRIVSGSEDHTVKVWDTAIGELTLTLNGHSGDVTSVVFSPDGRRIVSASVDKTVKIWEASPWE